MSEVRFRVGLGTDLHRLELGSALWLGGVRIPSDRGAVAHSDGDVVLHSIADALLGAIAEGDIGELFPDSDPAFSGLASRTIVEAAQGRVADRGYFVSNVDVVVELQSPKLLPHREPIRQKIAEILAIPVDRVGLKAKTAEGLGSIGAGEAIACQAVVLLALGGS